MLKGQALLTSHAHKALLFSSPLYVNTDLPSHIPSNPSMFHPLQLHESAAPNPLALALLSSTQPPLNTQSPTLPTPLPSTQSLTSLRTSPPSSPTPPLALINTSLRPPPSQTPSSKTTNVRRPHYPMVNVSLTSVSFFVCHHHVKRASPPHLTRLQGNFIRPLLSCYTSASIIIQAHHHLITATPSHKASPCINNTNTIITSAISTPAIARASTIIKHHTITDNGTLITSQASLPTNPGPSMTHSLL